MSSTKNNKTHYQFIDILKFFAIFEVVFYHSFNVKINTNFCEAADYVVYFVYTVLSTGVTLFFLINGFLLFQRECFLKRHILKVSKYVALTVIWGIITLFILMLLRNDSFTFGGFVKDLITLKQGYINYLWFMEALVFLHIVYPLLKWLYDKKFQIFQWVLLIVIIYTIICPTFIDLADITGKEVMWLTHLPNVYFSYALAYFMTGGYFYRIFDNKKIDKKVDGILLLFCIGLLVIQTIQGMIRTINMQSLFDNVWAGYHSLFIFLAVCMLFLLCYKNKIENIPNLIKSFGSHTLGIYFIHPIIIAFLLPVME